MTETAATRTQPDNLSRIVAAARTLFAEHGVASTRLEDVAAAAGMSRQHLYRYVSGRETLIELVLAVRCEEVGNELEARAAAGTDTDVAAAITEQIIAGIAIGRDDPEFLYLAEALPRHRLNYLLVSEASPLLSINLRLFRPLFAKALAAGLLRTDVTLDALASWLQGVMTMLAGREDLNDEGLRRVVVTFVLPSILA